MGHFHSGFVLGAKIGLAAVPFALVYRSLGVINFAFGEMMTFAAYAAYVLVKSYAWPFPAAVPCALGLTLGLGLIIERLAYRPLFARGDHDLSMVSSIGVSILLQGLYQAIFGSRALYLSSDGLDERWLFATLVAELGLVTVLLKSTRLGDQIAGVADESSLAQRVGINPSWIFAVGFAGSSALAALVGLFEMADNGVTPTMGFPLGLLAFASAILAGSGSPWRVVGAAMGLGLAIEFAQAGTVLNDRALWVGFVVMALVVSSVSRKLDRARRAGRGEDRG